jgi:hypothetical protein
MSIVMDAQQPTSPGSVAPRPPRPDITPTLIKPWVALALAGSAAVIGAIVVYVLLTWLLGLPLHVSNDKAGAPAERKILVEAFKAALGIAAGLGAVVALTLSYRRHRIEQSQSHRDDQRLFTERFQAAAEQLGHERPAVRLAGVHSLARLADDWDEQRQTCVDVLCAYLRLPPIAQHSAGAADGQARVDSVLNADEPVTPRDEREIRQTIVRLIAEHLRIDTNDRTRVSWQGLPLDFTGVVFDGGVFDFTGAKFSAGLVSFRGARFLGGRVTFHSAEFPSGRVAFSDAHFAGGRVSFVETNFSGGIMSFWQSKFAGAEVDFGLATFSGGVVRFAGAEFAGGSVKFMDAEFAGGIVDFSEVREWKHAPEFPPWEQPPEGLRLPSL